MQDLEPLSHLISISRLWTVEGTELSVLRLRGVLSAATHDDFINRLGDACARSRYVVLNLAEIPEVDAEAGRLIAQRAALLQARSGWLRVVSRLDARELSLPETLLIARTEDAAVRDLIARAA